MQNSKIKPSVVLAVAMMSFVIGGFLLVLQIGMSGRKARATRADIGFKSAAKPAASYSGDFERGGEIIKNKSENFIDEFFGNSPEEVPAAGGAVTAELPAAGENGAERDTEGDAFEEYYKKHYSGSGGEAPGADSVAGSWADFSGGGSFGGSGGSGASSASSASAPEPAGEEPKKGGEAAASAAGEEELPAFGGPDSGGKVSSDPKMYASLPAQGGSAGSGPGSGEQPGDGGGVTTGDGEKKSQKGGGMSGMSGMAGNGVGADLNSALENMKTASQNNYNADMKVKASEVAAAAGVTPGAAAGSAGGAGGGGGGSGGSGGGSSASGGSGGSGGGLPGGSLPKPEKAVVEEKTPDKDVKDKAAVEPREAPEPKAKVVRRSTKDLPENKSLPSDMDLLQAVVNDKLDGDEGKYISEEEGTGFPKAGLLVAGATDGIDANKDGVELGVDTPIDPETFSALSAKRKKELRKEVHIFLKKVENQFKPKKKIVYTPCGETPEVCKLHGLTQSYLTMTMSEGVKLVMGLKYADNRWHIYTLDFINPGAETVKPGSAVEPADEDEAEEEEQE